MRNLFTHKLRASQVSLQNESGGRKFLGRKFFHKEEQEDKKKYRAEVIKFGNSTLRPSRKIDKKKLQNFIEWRFTIMK